MVSAMNQKGGLMELSKNELYIIRMWFDALYYITPDHLKDKDKQLHVRILNEMSLLPKEPCGMCFSVSMMANYCPQCGRPINRGESDD